MSRGGIDEHPACGRCGGWIPQELSHQLEPGGPALAIDDDEPIDHELELLEATIAPAPGG